MPSSGEKGPITESPTVWDPTRLQDPHATADKHERVRGMFGQIAERYDLNNRLHSLWRDQAWRRFAVRQARLGPTDEVLDVACGTGDLTRAFAEAAPPPRRVVGLDFTPEMLLVAERKRRSGRGTWPERCSYQQGDAQFLPFPDSSFDVVSIAFGIRNVADPRRALREFARVIRPGGRLIVLEFGVPRLALVRWFNALYCTRVMPRTAAWLAGDRSGAYRYLPASVATFPDQVGLAAMMRDETGWPQVESHGLSLGICYCHRAIRPQ
ncbi:MAG: ubiquinone/menaquinone biosynthesis methyltransferase [Phycisphaerae bacterium]|nr:ubiquinone/menaquinone biosynthesis methyltransferase [Phycisphaerae bacterium]